MSACKMRAHHAVNLQARGYSCKAPETTISTTPMLNFVPRCFAMPSVLLPSCPVLVMFMMCLPFPSCACHVPHALRNDNGVEYTATTSVVGPHPQFSQAISLCWSINTRKVVAAHKQLTTESRIRLTLWVVNQVVANNGVF